MPFRSILVALTLLFSFSRLHAQQDSAAIPAKADTTVTPKKDSSKFDSFNKKMEHLFTIIPVPLYSYTSDAGNIFGLAKYNLLHLSKKDTISKPSKLSEVFTVSTKGRINASVSTELVFDQNKYVIIAFVNYKKQPEYIWGLGNSLSQDSVTQAVFDRLRIVATGLRLIAANFYAGIAFEYSNYFKVSADSNSFLTKNNTLGLAAGQCNGAGLALAYDARDNRYNPSKGAYIISSLTFYGSWLGSQYNFSKFSLDARKYFNPWLKHVIAIQATTGYSQGDVPFFQLQQLGGDSRMRGFYEGSLRDYTLIDGQVEYRMPVWKIFGITAFAASGRVANSYHDMSLDGFHFTFGGGIRIKVDSKNNTNLRFDMGFGPEGIKGFYINFAEAF